LVDDVGAALGCGATLRSLRRTRIGLYRVEDALSIEDLSSLSVDVPSEQRTYD
jgi:tRNA pseudouridine55 synthase